MSRHPPQQQQQQQHEEGTSTTNNTLNEVDHNVTTLKNIKAAMKYVYDPIDRQEITYHFLILCTVTGTVLTYFTPHIVTAIFVSLLSIILCIIIATCIWMWTVLPGYKRQQFIDRIREAFTLAVNGYVNRPQRKNDGDKDTLITHTF